MTAEAVLMNTVYSFYLTSPEEMSLFRRGVIYPLSKNGQSSSIRLTLLDSICKTESSDLVDNLLAWIILIAKKKNRYDGALDRNTARLSIGTDMHSGSEHRKTGRVFSYPSNVTSKYS